MSTLPSASGYDRLRRRAEFQAVAKGTRSGTPAFTLQTRRRPDEVAGGMPRFGLTLTKKTAPHAVDRNRMRRRLREALRLGAALSGKPGHDYVIVGRTPLLTLRFADLTRSLAMALEESGRVRSDSAKRRRGP